MQFIDQSESPAAACGKPDSPRFSYVELTLYYSRTIIFLKEIYPQFLNILA